MLVVAQPYLLGSDHEVLRSLCHHGVRHVVVMNKVDEAINSAFEDNGDSEQTTLEQLCKSLTKEYSNAVGLSRDSRFFFVCSRASRREQFDMPSLRRHLGATKRNHPAAAIPHAATHERHFREQSLASSDVDMPRSSSRRQEHHRIRTGERGECVVGAVNGTHTGLAGNAAGQRGDPRDIDEEGMGYDTRISDGKPRGVAASTAPGVDVRSAVRSALEAGHTGAGAGAPLHAAAAAITRTTGNTSVKCMVLADDFDTFRHIQSALGQPSSGPSIQAETFDATRFDVGESPGRRNISSWPISTRVALR